MYKLLLGQAVAGTSVLCVCNATSRLQSTINTTASFRFIRFASCSAPRHAASAASWSHWSIDHHHSRVVENQRPLSTTGLDLFDTDQRRSSGRAGHIACRLVAHDIAACSCNVSHLVKTRRALSVRLNDAAGSSRSDAIMHRRQQQQHGCRRCHAQAHQHHTRRAACVRAVPCRQRVLQARLHDSSRWWLGSKQGLSDIELTESVRLNERAEPSLTW